jgi:hypothetical protein
MQQLIFVLCLHVELFVIAVGLGRGLEVGDRVGVHMTSSISCRVGAEVCPFVFRYSYRAAFSVS